MMPSPDLEPNSSTPLDFDQAASTLPVDRPPTRTTARPANNTGLIRQAAEARGLPVDSIVLPMVVKRQVVPAQWLRIVAGKNSFIYRKSSLRRLGPDGKSIGRHINQGAVWLMTHKGVTKAIAASVGVGTPPGTVFSKSQFLEAARFFQLLGDVCVKPNSGKQGNCVFPHITTMEDFTAAFNLVAQRYDSILVELSVTGEVFRLFFIGRDTVAARIGIPSSVVGDGKSTVEMLVARKNAARRKAKNPAHKLIRLDQHALAVLKTEYLTPNSIPESGRQVFFRRTSNLSTGGDSIDYTDRLHPSYFRAVARVCRAFPELRVAGIDMMIQDFTAPAKLGNHWLLEVNNYPSILGHHYPWEGPPRDVASKIVEFLEKHF